MKTLKTPASLLDLYSKCTQTRHLRALYGTYIDLVSAQAIALSHVRQLDQETPLDGLVILLEQIEHFAVTHLQRAIEESNGDEL